MNDVTKYKEAETIVLQDSKSEIGEPLATQLASLGYVAMRRRAALAAYRATGHLPDAVILIVPTGEAAKQVAAARDRINTIREL